MAYKWMKSALIPLLAGVSLACTSFAVQAHKVIASAYADGALIEGEVGFSNGEMAKAGTELVVLDPSGDVIATLLLDEEGSFRMTATKRMTHTFQANMGAGHVAEFTLPAEDLPDDLEAFAGKAAVQEASDENMISQEAAVAGVTPAVLTSLINKAVAKQVIPLRRDLAAYKEKKSLTDMLGGIGYIFGLFGIGAYFRAKQIAKRR